MYLTSISVATLLAATATAGIIPAVKVDHLNKRDVAEWDKNGNIKLTCQCETNPIELKGQLFKSESVDDIKVTLGPDGSYPTWIRNGLIDTLAAAAKEVAKCEDGTYTNRCFGTTAMAYCPQRKTQYTNCEVPRFWGINYQDPGSANSAPPNVGVDIAMEKLGDGGICESVLTSLGAVAGAVHGVGGGVFTLLSFACEG
ncbi:hypothetical protein DDE82_004798 [Stemphylium lycopersici]|uniref:Uncharacterized protein n=1 Tax=Stemphylium lycopersici TaxID=183478 RepID=A0A364NA00_STELY|nr:hypothetical protein DDE82_004798 [Stemphylium lycopersici]RAR13851.1 hypothetical protein DDE83_002739 [Stemphylium lycopersici]